jgi:hypothetical protein
VAVRDRNRPHGRPAAHVTFLLAAQRRPRSQPPPSAGNRGNGFVRMSEWIGRTCVGEEPSGARTSRWRRSGVLLHGTVRTRGLLFSSSEVCFVQPRDGDLASPHLDSPNVGGDLARCCRWAHQMDGRFAKKHRSSTDSGDSGAAAVAGKTAAVGIFVTASVLIASSALDIPLGLPTAVAGLVTVVIVLILERSGSDHDPPGNEFARCCVVEPGGLEPAAERLWAWIGNIMGSAKSQHLMLSRPRDRRTEEAGDADPAGQSTVDGRLDEGWCEEGQ